MSTQHTVEIRRLRPREAGHVVDAVFAGMSPVSRRLRFHLPMTRLPGYIRRHLTQLDRRSRAAVVAWADGRPVGIGRLAAVSATEAEAAIAVVDAWHGRGLGRRLLTDLSTLASDLGYERLVAEWLEDAWSAYSDLQFDMPDSPTPVYYNQGWFFTEGFTPDGSITITEADLTEVSSYLPQHEFFHVVQHEYYSHSFALRFLGHRDNLWWWSEATADWAAYKAADLGIGVSLANYALGLDTYLAASREAYDETDGELSGGNREYGGFLFVDYMEQEVDPLTVQKNFEWLRAIGGFFTPSQINGLLMADAGTSFQLEINRFRWFTYSLEQTPGGADIGFDARFHAEDSWLPRLHVSDLPGGRVPHESVSLSFDEPEADGSVDDLAYSGAAFTEFTFEDPEHVSGQLVIDVTGATDEIQPQVAVADIATDSLTGVEVPRLGPDIQPIDLDDGSGSITVDVSPSHPTVVLETVDTHVPEEGIVIGHHDGGLDRHVEFIPTASTVTIGDLTVGMNRWGDLITGDSPVAVDDPDRVGLRFAGDPDSEVLARGCPCENWGIGAPGTSDAAFTETTYGRSATGIDQATLTSDSTSVTSSVTLTGGPGNGLLGYRITHHVHASPVPELVQMDVTVENFNVDNGDPLAYRRSIDWDMPPTPYDEAVSWQQAASAPFVRFLSDDGFGSTDLGQAPTWLTKSGYFSLAGACDEGAQIELELSQYGLGPLQSETFTLYYGLAADASSAEDAVEAVGAQVYNLAVAAGTSEAAHPVAILAIDGSALPESTAPALYGHPSETATCA
jgi:GNAT superfamily N-acetyltransferase